MLKGIGELHPEAEKRAEPLYLEQVQQLVTWIERQQADAGKLTNGYRLRLARNKALILLGFWRAFRSDELVRLTVENIKVFPGEGMELFVARTKTDRMSLGRSYRAPALRQLCPVNAYQDWITVSGITDGPVFPSIDRWGRVGRHALHPDSISGISCAGAAKMPGSLPPKALPATRYGAASPLGPTPTGGISNR